MGRKRTHQEFLEKLKEKNLKAYEELEFLDEYVNNTTKIRVKDKYGILLVLPNALLSGKYPTIYLAQNKTSYFIEKCKYMIEKEYDYSEVEYIRNNIKIKLKCKRGHNFSITPNSFLEGHGCSKCRSIELSERFRSNNDEFIKKANKIHDYRYDYSLVNYKGSKKKVSVICPEHGVFEQVPNTHLDGSGCPECWYEQGGYSRSDWVKRGSVSKKYKVYQLYKIRVYNDNEEFYKIGITYTELKDRFTRHPSFLANYKYEVLEIISSDDGYYIWDLEKELHRRYKDYKYKPLIWFSGNRECFTYIELD